MIIKKLTKEKLNIFELIIIVIIIGISIELISNGLNVLLDLNNSKGIIFGCFLLLLGFSYFIIKIIKLKTATKEFKGFIVYDKKKNKIIKVPRYAFSQNLCGDFSCAFKENPALKKIWNAEPISDRFKTDKNGKLINTIPRSFDIIIEATEYFILKQLSVHLSDYFNNDNHNKKKLQDFRRNDIPNVLLKTDF